MNEPISLLDYFAIREVSAPPNHFIQAEFPPTDLRLPNGKKAPQPLPPPAEIAAMIAKWRYLCADAMLKESAKRNA